MKDPKAFWKFLFAIGVLLAGFFTFFPAFTEDHAEVLATVHNIAQTPLEDDINNIKAELPPARYYVQDVQIAYLPDGTLRNLYVNLISQPNAKGKRVAAQIHRSKGSSFYQISYSEVENGIQKTEFDFEDLPRLFTPSIFDGLIPETSFEYVYVEGTPVLTDLDPHGEQIYYIFAPTHLVYGLKPEVYQGHGLPFQKNAGFPFDVFIMQRESEGHYSGEGKRFLLRYQR